MEKRAQISQVFIYIMVLLVVGVLIVVGYKGISSIMNAQCEHQRIVFERSILNFIDEYTDAGSVHEETLKAACNVKEVCFADSDFCPRESSLFSIDSLPAAEVEIRNYLSACTANIFVKAEFTEPLKNVNKFSQKISIPTTSHLECFKARNGNFKLVFTGLGSKVQIESGWN
ncbi:hypothetical protein JW756_01465 [Candidatus Woesearchaeota archaeon]|nr:hypothetical protein [Candidatus Woesearchaeota archaeon]